MKKYALLLILSIFLTSCGTNKEAPVEKAQPKAETASPETISETGSAVENTANEESSGALSTAERIRNLRKLRTQKLSGETASGGTSTEAITTAMQTDCKTIDANAYAIQPTGEVLAAMECINRAILSCTPATVKILGSGTVLLNVAGKEGENCIIENDIIKKPAKDSGTPYYSSCKFPIRKFIEPITSILEKKGTPKELFFMGLSFIKSSEDNVINADGWYDNDLITLDNETISCKCK